MDSYLQRFERYAKAQSWKSEKWSINLSALLTGKALDVYYRMPEEEVEDYKKVKAALFKNFQFTEEGFKDKFFTSKAQNSESAAQYYTRLKGYMDRWITLAKCNHTYEALRDLLTRTTFLNGCHTVMATHLKEFVGITNQDLIAKADIYLQAHGIQNLSYPSTKVNSDHNKAGIKKPFNGICSYCRRRGHHINDCQKRINNEKHQNVTCHYCKKRGHVQKDCYLAKGQINTSTDGNNTHHSTSSNITKESDSKMSNFECFYCKKKGHLARNCPKKETGAMAAQVSSEEESSTSSDVKTQHCVLHSCHCKEPHAAMFITDLEIQPKDGVTKVEREGTIYSVCPKDCDEVHVFSCMNLPTCQCVINGEEALMMRDSGCTGVVVHQKLVEPHQYLGENKFVLMIDGSVKSVPIARVYIDSPYYEGEVEAMVMKTPVYDVVLGNITKARNVADPNPYWKKKARYVETNKKEKDLQPDKSTTSKPDPCVQKISKEECCKEECSAVLTRSKAIKEKELPDPLPVAEIDYASPKQKDFSSEQQQDKSLKFIWNNLKDGKGDIKIKNNGKTWYELHNNILYRIFENSRKDPR